MSVSPEELHRLRVWQRGVQDAIAGLNAEIDASLEDLCIFPHIEIVSHGDRFALRSKQSGKFFQGSYETREAADHNASILERDWTAWAPAFRYDAPGTGTMTDDD